MNALLAAQLGRTARETTERLLKDPRLTHAQVAQQVGQEIEKQARTIDRPVGWGAAIHDEPSLM